jgi:hypothetical protein
MEPPGSKHRVHPLFGSKSLAQWVRAGGRLQRPSFCYFQRSRWHAHWFEFNWRTQVEAARASKLPEDPVFILGLWRSGTTVFHQLLAAAAEWNTPKTWQCFNPSTCFQTEPPPTELYSRRPMDRGIISTRSPQEDEFALLLLGEPSVYRGFIDPRRLRECGRELWHSDPTPLRRWQDFLRCMTLQGNGRLLLKSPSHTFRIPLLRALFPQARFVWVGKQIEPVLASNRRMWHEMTSRYALWNSSDETREHFLDDMLLATCRVLSRCLDEMPQDQLLWVDFEELAAQPRHVMRRVSDFLRLETIPERLDRAIDQIPVHGRSQATLRSDQSTQPLERLMAAARRRYGEATN